MVTLVEVLAALFLGGTALYLLRPKTVGKGVLALCRTEGPEEDVKTKLPCAGKVPEDDGEAEIRLYFRHKRSGNIDVARGIGEQLANRVLGFHLPQQDLEKNEKSLWPVLEEQARMMYVYTAETAARESSPDSILCQMVIAALNDGISDREPDFYHRMDDCRAYTVYKLCSTRRDQENICRHMGRAYCQLVGGGDGQQIAQLGSRLYLELTRQCRQAFSRQQYYLEEE